MIPDDALPPRPETGDDVVETSLLDLVDNLLDNGCVVTGDLLLGLADVDLIYIEVSALLCAADRLLPRARPRAREPER